MSWRDQANEMWHLFFPPESEWGEWNTFKKCDQLTNLQEQERECKCLDEGSSGVPSCEGSKTRQMTCTGPDACGEFKTEKSVG